MTLSDVINNTIGLINHIIPVVIALAFVFFMWSGVQYVRKAGGEGVGEARNNMLWGVLALFIIFTIWGLLNILCVTFFNHLCGA
jgi:hypothetical protein